jgi:hypothetical protein
MVAGERVRAKMTAAPAIAGREGVVTAVYPRSQFADVDFGDVHTMISLEHLEPREASDD